MFSNSLGNESKIPFRHPSQKPEKQILSFLLKKSKEGRDGQGRGERERKSRERGNKRQEGKKEGEEGRKDTYKQRTDTESFKNNNEMIICVLITQAKI